MKYWSLTYIYQKVIIPLLLITKGIEACSRNTVYTNNIQSLTSGNGNCATIGNSDSPRILKCNDIQTLCRDLTNEYYSKNKNSGNPIIHQALNIQTTHVTLYRRCKLPLETIDKHAITFCHKQGHSVYTQSEDTIYSVTFKIQNNQLDVFVQKSYDHYNIQEHCSYSIEIKEKKSQNAIQNLFKNSKKILSFQDFMKKLSSIDGMNSSIQHIRDFFDSEKSSTPLKSSSPSNKPSPSFTLLATLPLVVQNMVGGYLERF